MSPDEPRKVSFCTLKVDVMNFCTFIKDDERFSVLCTTSFENENRTLKCYFPTSETEVIEKVF